MKTYIKIFIAGLSLAGLASCSDSFLDTNPVSEKTSGTSQSLAEAQASLTGCYDGLQTAYGYGGAQFLIASEIMSDNCFAGGGTSDNTNFMAIDAFDKGYVSEYSMMENYWKNYYTTINRCNMLIASDNTTDWEGNETERGNILGQAYALRALCYFDLVRLYGKVPLLTSSSTAKVAETEPAVIFEQIAADLKFAAENIHFGAYSASSWETTYNGLVSEWAAKALLARVYLFYNGFYGATLENLTESEVKAYLEDIINNGGFGLVEDFATLWPASSYVENADGTSLDESRYAGESNKEILFSLKFDTYKSPNSLNTGETYYNGNGAVTMMSMRNTTFAPYATGWGVAPANPRLYTAYLPADKRRDASIINLTSEGIESSGSFNTGNDWRQYTGYTCKKYSATGLSNGTRTITLHDPSVEQWQYQEEQDMAVVRYADVLLMAAELGCANAQGCFDQVRDRAFGDTSHRRPLTTDNILEERRLEFAFEGLRYWDLLRIKGLNESASILASNQDGVTVKTGGETTSISFSAANMIEKGGLLLKPQAQITLMGTDYLSQNTGW